MVARETLDKKEEEISGLKGAQSELEIRISSLNQQLDDRKAEPQVIEVIKEVSINLSSLILFPVFFLFFFFCCKNACLLRTGYRPSNRWGYLFTFIISMFCKKKKP